MAATVEASRLTEAHRLAQARLAVQTTLMTLRVWDLLDPLDLAGTTARWLSVLLPVLQAQRRTSATLAANYLSTFRALELGVDAAPFAAVLADALDREATSTSLVVTGPAAVRRALAASKDITAAVELGKAGSARAAARHVLNGGRDTITGTVAADPKALGYARATSGKACAFCAMLAARGAVYKSEESAGKGKDWHDGCHCEPEAVYRRDAALPAGSDRYAELYQQAKTEAGGGDVLNSLRRILAGQHPPTA